MVLVVNNSPANAGDIRGVSAVPGLGRSPGGGHGRPLRYSCLENPKDGGAWWATVLRVAKSCLWLKPLSILTLGFVYSFSNCFGHKIRLLMWEFSCFLRLVCIAKNFSLRNAFIASHMFQICIFSFFSRYFFYFLFEFFSGSLVV